MVTPSIRYLLYYNTKGKEVRHKYPQPVSLTRARTDAIQLLRAGKVGLPPGAFTMVCVVPSTDADGEGGIEQIILQRAVSGNSPIFYCARAWNHKLHKWIWLTDKGRVKSNVQAW